MVFKLCSGIITIITIITILFWHICLQQTCTCNWLRVDAPNRLEASVTHQTRLIQSRQTRLLLITGYASWRQFHEMHMRSSLVRHRFKRAKAIRIARVPVLWSMSRAHSLTRCAYVWVEFQTTAGKIASRLFFCAAIYERIHCRLFLIWKTRISLRLEAKQTWLAPVSKQHSPNQGMILNLNLYTTTLQLGQRCAWLRIRALLEDTDSKHRLFSVVR